ncbi:hypothetical protein FQR65_LT08841 [Abscondita terminalis]|nr:hypothetical protein FQR65_LT08841 [Abscondita terminalis]
MKTILLEKNRKKIKKSENSQLHLKEKDVLKKKGHKIHFEALSKLWDNDSHDNVKSKSNEEICYVNMAKIKCGLGALDVDVELIKKVLELNLQKITTSVKNDLKIGDRYLGHNAQLQLLDTTPNLDVSPTSLFGHNAQLGHIAHFDSWTQRPTWTHRPLCYLDTTPNLDTSPTDAKTSDYESTLLQYLSWTHLPLQRLDVTPNMDTTPNSLYGHNAQLGHIAQFALWTQRPTWTHRPLS